MGILAEIGAVLKLDDRATETLSKVKEGFGKVGEKVHEVQHEMAGFLKQTASVAIGVNLGGGIEAIKEFGHEVLKAALEEKAQQKALTGTLLLTDQLGRSMKELRHQAEEVSDEFEQFGIDFGTSKEAMLDAFTGISERSNKTTEEVRSFTKEMFFAGKALSGGMQELSAGFQAVEMGNFRATNGIVKLVTAQHLLKGNAKEVTKQMMKMTAPERLKLAEDAVHRMAEKMKPAKGADLGYEAVISSLKQIRERLFETVGFPLVEHLGKQLNRLRRYFIDNEEAVQKWAHELGDKLGQYIDSAADKMREGFQYLQDHAAEISHAIQEAWRTAKDVVTFILAHKEELAMAYGANMAKNGVQGALKMGAGLAGEGAGLAASAGAFLALTAAIVAWGMVADQLRKLYNETGGFKTGGQQDDDARLVAAQKAVEGYGELTKDQLEDFAKFRAAAVNGKDGPEGAALGAQFDAIWNQHMAQNNSEDKHGIDASATAEDQAGYWIAIYNKAEKEHNAALMDYATTVLVGSDMLQASMLTSSDEITGGLDAFADKIATKSASFAAELHDKAKSDLANAKKASMTVNNNFSGGQTFQIKQDFRDQDPDRIAAIFQKDVLKAAEFRRGARFGSALGI